MPRAEYSVRTKVWRYPGKGGWHFANLSLKQSRDIKELFGGDARGWGSLPVTVRIGATEWRTSIFPDRKSRTYLLAIKADVRRKERIAADSAINATIWIE